MADSSKKNDKPAENIFKIMDEIVYQLNKSRKMFTLMIIASIIVVPATHIITPHLFGIAQAIVVVFVLALIAIGIRQWFALSKWTKRYELYKELQKKVDEKLDYDEDKEGKQ